MLDTGKIIITGTGRSGTTFLVQLLTELGLDTGYTSKTWQQDYDAQSAAGLEHDFGNTQTPRILKNPAFCETLPALLAGGAMIVDHAIIPMRALDDAARSRVWIGGRGKTAGGLWGTADAARQKSVLAEKFHLLLHTLTIHNIPHTLLEFPRFAREAGYTWQKLHWLLGDTDRETFDAAFARVARPELIHDFSNGVPAGAGAAARLRARIQLNRRLQRRAKRVMFWGAVAVAVWAVATWIRT
jgi:hypothetical protein